MARSRRAAQNTQRSANRVCVITIGRQNCRELSDAAILRQNATNSCQSRQRSATSQAHLARSQQDGMCQMPDAMPTVVRESVAATSVVWPVTRRAAERVGSFNVLSFTLATVRASYLLIFVLRRLSSSAAVIDPNHGRELTVISQLLPANDHLPFEQIAPPRALFPASHGPRASLVDAILSGAAAPLSPCRQRVSAGEAAS
jgi:hypothetical protein